MYQHIPDSHLSFARAEPKSAECPHASSTRAGRVAVASRALAGLVRVGSIEDARWASRPPRFLDIPERGEWLVLERPGATTGGIEVRTGSGVIAFARETISNGSHVMARPERYYVDAAWHDWSGAGEGTRAEGALQSSGELLAIALRGDEAQTLIASPDGRTPDRPLRPDFTRVVMERPFDASFSKQYSWGYKVDEPGVGAIDGAGLTAMALPSGRFVVLRTTGDAEKLATLAVDAPIDPAATDLSVIPPFAVVLHGGGDAGILAGRRATVTTSTRVDAHRPDGSLAWRAEAPFVAAQPPIDGDGRIYIVGGGIAALDMEGKTVWSSASRTTLRAQAFADGALAVVRGSTLEIVGNDGVIRQSLSAAEEVTSYPAIASDGSVWVASEKSLYVAR